MSEITKDVAAKVLSTVDAGLVPGLGIPEPGKMCVEAAVCYALGLPHGDDPACVSRAVRSLKICLNDKSWPSDDARAKGLRRLALAQLGSAGAIDDKEFAKRVSELAIRKMVPIGLRAAAEIQKHDKHRKALRLAANRCEVEGTYAAAKAAAKAAYAAAKAAANAAYAAAGAAACAANAAYAAGNAAGNAAGAAGAAAYAAYAAGAAAYAAYAAADAVGTAKSDKILSDFAEGVVQVLIEMNAPGCQWLYMTESRQ